MSLDDECRKLQKNGAAAHEDELHENELTVLVTQTDPHETEK